MQYNPPHVLVVITTEAAIQQQQQQQQQQKWEWLHEPAEQYCEPRKTRARQSRCRKLHSQHRRGDHTSLSRMHDFSGIQRVR